MQVLAMWRFAGFDNSKFKESFLTKIKSMKTFLFLLISLFSISGFAQNSTLKITIYKDPNFPSSPQITFEYSIFKAIYHSRVGDDGLVENGFADWILKRTGKDEINILVDGNVMRFGNDKVENVRDLPTTKTVRITYLQNTFVNEYTIYDNQPNIKCDYKIMMN
jgi:hypothetical protein